jgi:hypothetical protein
MTERIGSDILAKKRGLHHQYRVFKNERAVQIGISFSPDLFEQIDKLRGREPRSQFVCRMLEEYFAVKPSIIADASKREKEGKE